MLTTSLIAEINAEGQLEMKNTTLYLNGSAITDANLNIPGKLELTASSQVTSNINVLNSVGLFSLTGSAAAQNSLKINTDLSLNANLELGAVLFINPDLNINFISEGSFNLGFKDISEIILTASAQGISNISTEIKGGLMYLKANINFDSSLNITFVSDEEVILILDPELNLVGQLDNFEDFMWTRRWRKPDSFELTIDRNKNNADELVVDNYITKKRGDVVHAGRIKDRQLRKDLNGEVLTVFGKGLGEIFENRIAFNKVNEGDGYDTVNTAAETAMKYYVEVNVKDPVIVERKVDNLKIDTDRKLGKTVTYRARFQKISEILYELSRNSGLGWDITLDLNTKEFVFNVLYATIRTGIRFSEKMDAVLMTDYKESYSEAENTAIIGGAGSAENRQIVTVNKNDL